MSQKNTEPNQNPNRRSVNIVSILLVGFIITFLFNAFFGNGIGNNSTVSIGYNQFIDLVEQEVVEQVKITDTEILIGLKEDTTDEVIKEILGATLNERQSSLQKKTYVTGVISDPELVNRLLEYDVNFNGQFDNTDPMLSFIANWIITMVIIYVIYYFIMRFFMKRLRNSGLGNSMNNPGNSGMFGMMGNTSNAKEYNMEKSTGITFADVAGQDEAKESLLEMVDYLNNPKKYQEIGAKQPKGALLVGPPGTGKTLLAKAVAGEAKVPFFSISGSEFVEMFVGMGAKRVRDLFQEANKKAPCIIFIDEIDAIGKSRANQIATNDEREQTLNQLLAEMDGFDSSKGIVILAATNRPEVLDQALLRPGRFDRRIVVERPDLPGREEILKVHTAKVKLDSSVNLKEIALSTSGATGADLANMVNEAALHAVKFGRKAISQDDLQEAVEVVVAGKEKKDRILNPKEKRMVAYHEVGHALASALQKDAQPVQKITIVPRTMGSLGYTMQMPEEERYLLTKAEIHAQIVVLLAGRAAEEVIFGESSTGASNDIERATALARSMVTEYGMTERFDMMGLESQQMKYLDGSNQKNYSEGTGMMIDEEVREIIVKAHEEAINLLMQNREKLVDIAEYLVQKETITGEKFMELLKKAE